MSYDDVPAGRVKALAHEQMPGLAFLQAQISSSLSRRIWDPRTRRQCADRIANFINASFGIDLASLPPGGQEVAQELRDKGLHFPAPFLSAAQAGELRAHFERRKPPVDKDNPQRYYHPVRDIIEAPGLLELALSDKVLAPLAHYFGTMPFLTGLRAWWMEHGAPVDGDQIPHRDQTDIWFSKMFIYLSDVTTSDAPHNFFPGTHNYAYVKEKLLAAGVPKGQLLDTIRYVFEANFTTIGADIIDIFKNEAVTIIGKAGTTFLADTVAIHQGGVPEAGHTRLVFCGIYGMNLDPASYRHMSELPGLPNWRHRIGSSPLAQHAIRPWM